MQGVLNPPTTSKVEREVKDVIFREGDKVMMVKNNYDIEWTDDEGRTGSGVFNGDIGFITEIDRAEESFTIEFDDGRQALFDYSCFDDIEHAYAITVHKSQGSEYPVVIIPLYGCAPMLMTRNLLYTAVTRAAKMVQIENILPEKLICRQAEEVNVNAEMSKKGYINQAASSS